MNSRHVPSLPEPIATFVAATNSLDLDALLATFVDDALVNDQFQEYWGKQAICIWAMREIIGSSLHMTVVDSGEHYGHVIVRASARTLTALSTSAVCPILYSSTFTSPHATTRSCSSLFYAISPVLDETGT
jgi:hypothetical protein